MSSPKAALAEVEPSGLPATHPALALQYLTLAEFARVLGKATARSARDWCQRHQVQYRRDGKHNWVYLDDVRQALERLPLHHAPNNDVRESAADAAVAALTMKK